MKAPSLSLDFAWNKLYKENTAHSVLWLLFKEAYAFISTNILIHSMAPHNTK
jgi:hypothetical protein